MDWKGYADQLKSVLDLKGSPIAVTYSMDPDPRGKGGRHWVCHALQRAREGEIFSLSRQTSSCAGGTFHLGLGPRPTGEADKTLKEFLIRGEKLFCSLATVQRVRSLTLTPPLGLADHVLIAPLEAAEEKPDLVIFLVNPEQACRLLTLATFMDGIPPRMQVMGSACYMTITYPLISGEINLSLLDYTARRMRRYVPEELFLTIPFHKMDNLIQSIPLCSAGTAEIEIPSAFRRYMSEETASINQEKEVENGQEMAR